jgi:hypothetical protein
MSVFSSQELEKHPQKNGQIEVKPHEKNTIKMLLCQRSLVSFFVRKKLKRKSKWMFEFLFFSFEMRSMKDFLHFSFAPFM